jgi:hypothetical protein
MEPKHIITSIGLVVAVLISGFVFWELNRNTGQENFYLVDKSWDIKTSEYYQQSYTDWEEKCTGTGKDRKCSRQLVTKTREVWIRDCRTAGGYNDPVVYPDCPKSRSDSYFRTTEYFMPLFGNGKEKMTLRVDLGTYEALRREQVCNLDVYRGMFGSWLRGLNSCR